jgi:hypothetical protein
LEWLEDLDLLKRPDFQYCWNVYRGVWKTRFYDNETDNYQTITNCIGMKGVYKLETNLAFIIPRKDYYEIIKRERRLSAYGFTPVVINELQLARTNFGSSKNGWIMISTTFSANYKK